MSTTQPESDASSLNLVQRFDAWLDDEMSPRRAIVVYGVLFVYFAFLMGPMIYLFISTLTGSEALYSPALIPPLSELTLANYVTVVTTAQFQLYFFNSIIVATSTTVLVLVTGTFAAYGLSRFEFPGKQYVVLGYLSTQMLPRVLILIPFFLLMFSLNLVDTRLGIILSHAVIGLPFSTWLLKGYFDDIPEALDEAAMMDGCSRLQVLRKVILPLATPGIAVAGFYTFILSWNDFLFVSVLSQTAATRTLPFGLQLYQSGHMVAWHLTLTAAAITIVPVIVLFAFLQEYVVEGLAGGGMKGK